MPPTNLVFIDFETAYSTEYSLTRLTEKQYVTDPRFKVFGAGVAINDDKAPVWLTGSDLTDFIRSVDWRSLSVVGHNLNFDSMILTQHYGVDPGMHVDTLGMARAVVGTRLKSLSLDSLGHAFGLGGKMDGGKALADLRGVFDPTPEQLARLGHYCVDDVKLTRALFNLMARLFPEGEYDTLDWTIRMAVNPRVLIDPMPLTQLELEEQKEKAEKLAAAQQATGCTKTQLSSNPQFAALLTSLGVTPPTKTSKTTGKETYAFAKSDEAFLDLLDHPDDRVHDVVAARLSVKSTIKESRAAKLKSLSGNGPLPVILKYSGAAQTHRLCLVGDTRIVVRRAGTILEVDLASLRASDKVWDGTAFVTHGGLAYAGVKEVMTYDGITGTPDHRVLVAPPGEQPRFVGLAEAAARGIDICAGSTPAGFRFEAGMLRAGDATDASDGSVFPLRGGEAHTFSGHREGGAGVVQVVRQQGTHGGQGDDPRRDRGSPEGERGEPAESAGRGDAERMGTAYAMGEGGQTAMREPEPSRVQELRRAGDRVSVPVPVSGCAVGVSEPWAEAVARAVGGPDQQRGPLRAGEPAMGYGKDTEREPLMARGRLAETYGVEPGRMALRADDGAQPDSTRADTRTDHGTRAGNSAEQTRTLEGRRREAATYDIVDCGPRNQFVANGRIVHNSGGGGLNLQNFTRGSLLRKSIVAPDGKLLVAADLSQVELRGNCKASGQTDILDTLSTGGDVYMNFARQVYGDDSLNKKDNPQERTVGKVAELSLGYYSGAPVFKAMLRAMAGIRIDAEEAQRIVRLYRRTHQMISGAWRIYGKWIEIMAHGEAPYLDHPIDLPIELLTYGFRLPSGLEVTYPGLTRYDFENQQPLGLDYQPSKGEPVGWAYRHAHRAGGYAKLHAGVLNNNLIQSVCRDIIMDKTRKIRQLLPDVDPTASVVMSIHDEVITLAQEDRAQAVLDMKLAVMKEPVPWWPGLPLDAEGAIGKSYYDCK